MLTKSNVIPESDMIPVIKYNLLDSLAIEETNAYSTAEEFRSSYGIPDIMFYNFNEEIIQTRINKKISPILSKEILKTLILLQGKQKVTLSYLEDSLPYNKDVIKNKILKFLIKHDFISKSLNSDTYFIDNEYQDGLESLYSVEAKIAHWKRGFYQAYRYKWFSHYSFLALHEKHIQPALKNIDLFKEHNIGLIEVSTETNTTSLHFKPTYEASYSKEFSALTYERLFASYCEKKADCQ